MARVFKGIVAMTDNDLIGNGNNMPWPPEKSDFKFFKRMTLGQNVIIGRKTYESLPKPFLPNRKLWIMTRDKDYKFTTPPTISGCEIKLFSSIEELPDDIYWVAGGAEIYKMFLPILHELFVTRIEDSYEGDTFFPPISESPFSSRKIEFVFEGFEVHHYSK